MNVLLAHVIDMKNKSFNVSLSWTEYSKLHDPLFTTMDERGRSPLDFDKLSSRRFSDVVTNINHHHALNHRSIKSLTNLLISAKTNSTTR